MPCFVQLIMQIDLLVITVLRSQI